MDDQLLVYGTAAVLLSTVVFGVFRKSFDPFAPLWMFLTGYFQIYVIQAISYRDCAIRARGADLVTRPTARAFWALVWFLAVYHCGIGQIPRGAVSPAPSPSVSHDRLRDLAVSDRLGPDLRGGRDDLG